MRCLMSELIPVQNTQFLALIWHFLIPKCPSCIARRIYSLSNGGMMTTSPWRMRPSSTVRMFLWPRYGHRAHGTSLISSGQPVMIISAREWRSGSSWMRVWNSVFLSGVMCTWLMVMSKGISGTLRSAYQERTSATNISVSDQYLMVTS